MDLTRRILEGDVRAAARLMTMIENGTFEARAALKSLYAHTGSAYIIGITGPQAPERAPSPIGSRKSCESARKPWGS